MSYSMTPGEANGLSDRDREPQALVTFALGRQRYGIDIHAVREIRIVPSITPLPGAPEHVRGVINLRGTIVPVCDLRVRFGLEDEVVTGSGQGGPSGMGTVLVIAAIGGKLTGLVVDEVCDILPVERGSISPIPETGTAKHSPFFQGLISDGEHLLIVVAPERLMAGAEVALAPAA